MVVPGAEWSAGVVHGAGKVVSVQVTTAQPATIKVSWPAGGPGMPPGAVTTHRQGMDAVTKNVFAELEPADKQLSIKAVKVYVRPVNSLLRPSSATSTGRAGAQALAALLRLVNQAAFNFSSVRGKLSECEDATALLDSLLPWLQDPHMSPLAGTSKRCVLAS